MTSISDAFVVAQQKVFCLVICASKAATREQVEAAAQRLVPCGTRAGWHAPEHWNGDENAGPNPAGSCDQDSDRVHWYVGM